MSLPPLPISDKEVRGLFGFCHPGFLILSQTDLHPEKDALFWFRLSENVFLTDSFAVWFSVISC